MVMKDADKDSLLTRKIRFELEYKSFFQLTLFIGIEFNFKVWTKLHLDTKTHVLKLK